MVAEHTMLLHTPQSPGIGSQYLAQSPAPLHIELATTLIFAFAEALTFDLAVNNAGS